MSLASRLRRRVEFQRRIDQADEYGNVKGDWQLLVATRGSLKVRTAREPYQAGRPEPQVPGVLSVRYSAKTADVTGADRVLIDGEAHSIQAVDNWMGRNKQLDFTVVKGAV